MRNNTDLTRRALVKLAGAAVIGGIASVNRALAAPAVSLFDGKRFDLGFYEAGSSKKVHFDRPGVSFLFCNIHPEMSAAVVAVDTPYFGISDRTGRVSIPNVPESRYLLSVWYERSLQADLKSVSRVVTISDTARSLEAIRVIENTNFTLEHKNKYGQDYVPPASTSPSYKHP